MFNLEGTRLKRVLDQIKSQRSGFDLERRSDEMSELRPAGGSEGYGVRFDEGV